MRPLRRLMADLDLGSLQGPASGEGLAGAQGQGGGQGAAGLAGASSSGVGAGSAGAGTGAGGHARRSGSSGGRVQQAGEGACREQERGQEQVQLGPVSAEDLAAAMRATKPTGGLLLAQYARFAAEYGQTL
jgi:hypothetical protein